MAGLFAIRYSLFAPLPACFSLCDCVGLGTRPVFWITDMPDTDHGQPHKRTAVLVVHGIGSQRALETVRGVIRGVWLDSDAPDDHGKRIWNHPEPNGTDNDLAVMTTNAVPGAKDRRQVDFHELTGPI